MQSLSPAIYLGILWIKVISCIEKQPDLKQFARPENMKLLQCTVFNYDSKFKVHFHCTLGVKEEYEDRCYEDCIPITEKYVFTKCYKDVNGSTAVFNYVLNTSLVPSGSYRCSYKSESSHSILHVKENKIEVTTRISTTTKSTDSNPPKPLTIRYEIVLSLLLVLTLSIVLNLVFFIRCLLLRCLIQKGVQNHLPPTKHSFVSCLCIDPNANGAGIHRKTRDELYDNIREMHPEFDTSKSKSSGDRDSQNFLISPTSSQLTRSSTFPYKHALLVHTPTDQMPMSTLPPYPYNVMPYIIESGQCFMAPVLNHRLSTNGIYDDVAADASTMPIRQFASTGSLNHRPKRYTSSHSKASPLPEEMQHANIIFTNRRQNSNDGGGSVGNDLSSTYDAQSFEETYLSEKESESMNDPVRAAKLEMSREMMAKADTLLREAHNLLK